MLDSFPVPICDHIRIPSAKLVSSEDYRGDIASKKRYFYSIRVQLLATADGIPVEFVFLYEIPKTLLHIAPISKGNWKTHL